VDANASRACDIPDRGHARVADGRIQPAQSGPRFGFACRHDCHIFLVVLLIFCASESDEKLEDDPDDDEVGFEGTPKPMLPYSSLFIFGPTNP